MNPVSLTEFETPLATPSARRRHGGSPTEEVNGFGRHLENLHPAPGLDYIDLFEQSAGMYPDRCAVSQDGRYMTYQMLDRQADDFAQWVTFQGGGPDVVIAVCLDRSIELLIALLGILKAGAAFLPLDPDLPEEKIKEIFQQSGAKFAIVGKRSFALFEGADRPVECWGTGECFAKVNCSPAHQWSRLKPQNLAYVIYTSGSTGQPKGVGISREAFRHYIHWAAEYYRFDTDGTALLHTSISFDLTLTSLFCPLLVGMRVHMLPGRDAFAEVMRLLQERQERVSLLKLTPTHLSLLEEACADGPVGWDCDVLIVGGEKLHNRNVRFWERQSPQCRIYNEYGPTEATVGCCVTQVTSADCGPEDSLPIGIAIKGTELHVCDPQTLLSSGSNSGELYIAGRTLARGYLNAPALTAEKFIPSPFSGGARLYKTGDAVRSLPDWRGLVFLGRQDRQVKLNGIRVELEEIERAVRDYPGIRAAAATILKERDGSELLVCYLQLSETNERRLRLAELLGFLKGRLNQGAVPQMFYLLAELPVNINGKIDYRALRESVYRREPLIEEFHPPRNPLEELLASLWRSVLDVEEIGIDDTFFSLDGNSMKSIQFIYEAKKVGLHLSTRDLFDHQTIRELAAVLDREEAAGAAGESSQVGPLALLCDRDRLRLPAEIEDAYPLTTLQAGTLFESDHRTGSGTYHNINSYHLECPLDVDAFERSLESVARRHPILRTAYDFVSYNRPLQLVYKASKIPLHVVDLRDLDEASQETAITDFIREESGSRFDWTKPPLLRFFIHVRGSKRFQFTLSKHHSILDGWSAANLISEIVRNYFTLRNTPDAMPAPKLETCFRDYVALELKALESETCAQFWRQKLESAPYHSLERWGREKPQPDCSHSSISTRAVPLPIEVSAALIALSKQAQTPLKSVLLAIHLRVLAQMTGTNRLVTGVVTHGRPETADADKAIGLFINTVPFLSPLDDRSSWFDFIQNVFGEERAIFPFQRYPMARIKQDLKRERLFDSIFYYTDFHVLRGFRNSEDLKFISSRGFEETETPFTVAFSKHPLTSTLSLNLHFHIDKFSEQQVCNVLGYFERALRAVAGEPSALVTSQEILSDFERQTLCPEWKAPKWDQEANSVWELFKNACERFPDRPALVADAVHITYAALRRKSEKLARRFPLSTREGECVIAICLPDPVQSVVAMLAVNRAGLCYSVLDTNWPPEKLKNVLHHLRPTVIITDDPRTWAFAEQDLKVVSFNAENPAHSVTSNEEETFQTIPERLAYIIFTSGSTGQPKGVMATHRNLVESTKTRMEYYQEHYERFLLLSPLSFDSAFAGVWGTLCGGGTLYFGRGDRTLDLRALSELIANDSITHFLAIPSLHRQLLPRLADSGASALKCVIVAGEELPVDLADAHIRSLDAVRLFNEYGPTEGTVWATVAEVNEQCIRDNGRRVSIGRALDTTQALVLNDQMRLVAGGVVGELYLGGSGITRGYLRAPAETASRYVPNPYNSEGMLRAVLYKTGDLVCYLPSGELRFVGRADNQIKVRGYRIEPEEIEKAFHRRFAVLEAGVAASTDAEGKKQIVLYYVSPPDKETTSFGLREIRSALGAELPSYLLPDEAHRVEALPRLSNGKLDRKNLSTLAAREVTAEPTKLSAPENEIERTIWAEWKDALGAAPAETTRSFFESGGDSLSANRVVLRLEKIFGIRVPIAEFYRNSSIVELAAFLEQEAQAAALNIGRMASIWNRLG